MSSGLKSLGKCHWVEGDKIVRLMEISWEWMEGASATRPVAMGENFFRRGSQWFEQPKLTEQNITRRVEGIPEWCLINAVILSVTMNLNMETDTYMEEPNKYITSLVATAVSSTSVYLRWEVPHDSAQNILNFRVYFQQVSSTYIKFSDFLESTAREHMIPNLVTDTYYRVCLIVYRNDTAKPIRQCEDMSTANWQIPVSIGSSIGAVLALSIIVLLVLIARCPSASRKAKKSISDSAKYDSMSSHVQADNYEMSDTTLYGCHDDEVFSEAEISAVDATTPSLVNSHGSEKGSNGNQNYIKPHTHVLHVHATRTSSNPLRVSVPHMNNNHATAAPSNPRHTVVKLEHSQCSRQHTL